MIQPLTSATTKVALDQLGQLQGLNGSQLNTVQSPENSAVDFGTILSKMTNGVSSSLQNAESLSIQKMTGSDVGVREVVNSVMEAERSLSTAIAIRDKIVTAYLEVSRMQI